MRFRTCDITHRFSNCVRVTAAGGSGSGADSGAGTQTRSAVVVS
jgi:hypothetical protein